MTSSPLVVLDACVLASFSLCDTLLRLAEPARLFEPRWSEEIMRETTRTLEKKLGWPNSLTVYLEAELRTHFSEAWISGYQSLIAQMTNGEKDRHLVAAAAHCQAPVIVTFNFLTSVRNISIRGASLRCTLNRSFADYSRFSTQIGDDQAIWPSSCNSRT